jgi:hypothetical protein
MALRWAEIAVITIYILNVIGSNNTITKQQSGTTNFNETTVSGNTNNLTNIQQGNSPKILFQNVNGNSNTVTTNQKDTGTSLSRY